MSTEQGKTEQDRSERPLSPCVLICTLDDNKCCMGCDRTLQEITTWALMTAEEQWRIVDELPARQT